MAKGNEIIIKLRIDDKGNLKKATSQTDKLSKSTDKAAKSSERLQKSRDKYNRTEKGVAQISSNSTKNFSKMQQSIDGGGGSGGLVRAYALLAANVFALTAAFGVLSRASQNEVLFQSIERLEVVSGKSIRQVGRDLQEASGFSLDFASALRSVSLATSAGFNTKQIQELGEVAKNASVALGRNLSDSLDRIFRGVIKVEPELLDEIGLFVRVNDAANKYAAQLGIAAADLTEFQKRQAFTNEAIEQGQSKFKAFADVDPAPLDQLAASLADIAQNALSLVTSGLNPILSFFQANQEFLAAAFSGVAIALLRQAVPALGTFAINAKKAAQDARTAFEETQTKIQESLEGPRLAKIKEAKDAEKEITDNIKERVGILSKSPSRAGGDRAVQLRQELKGADTIAQKEKISLELKKKLNQASRNAGAAKKKEIKDEINAIDALIAKLREQEAAEIKVNQAESMPVAGVARPGSPLADEELATNTRLLKANRVEAISNKLAIGGLSAGFSELGEQLNNTEGLTDDMSKGTRRMIQANTLAKGSFILLGQAINKAFSFILPFTIALSVLSPVFVFLAKAIGLTSDESRKFDKTLASLAEKQENFKEKLDASNKTLNDSSATARAQSEALAAQENAVSELAFSIIDLIEANDKLTAQRGGGILGFFDKFKEKARLGEIEEAMNDLITKIVETGTANAAFEKRLAQADTDLPTLEAAIKKFKELQTTIDAAKIGGVEEAFNLPLQKANKAMEDFKKQNENLLPLLNFSKEDLFAIANETRAAAAAAANLRSNLDGTRDSARAFSKSFIKSTDVDQVLASVIGLRKGLEGTLNPETGDTDRASDQQRLLAIAEIVKDESEYFSILTKEEVNRLKQLEISTKVINKVKRTKEETQKLLEEEEKFNVIIAEAEERLQLQQQTILLNKNAISRNTAEMKMFANAIKASNSGLLLQSNLSMQNLKLQVEITAERAKNAQINAKITETETKAFMEKLKLGKEQLMQDEEFQKNRTAIIGAIDAQFALEQEQLKLEIAQKNQAFNLEKQILELSNKTLDSQLKLNKALQEQAVIRRKTAIARSGQRAQQGALGNLADELDAFAEDRKVQNEKLNNEIQIANLKTSMLEVEEAMLNKRMSTELEIIKLKAIGDEELQKKQQASIDKITSMLNEPNQVSGGIEQIRNEIDLLSTEATNTTESLILKSLEASKAIFSQGPNLALNIGDNFQEGQRFIESSGALFNQRRSEITGGRTAEEIEAAGTFGNRSDTALGQELAQVDADEKLLRLRTNTQLASQALTQLAEGFKQFGPDGEVGAAMAGFGATLSASFADLTSEGEDSAKNKLAAVGSIVGSLAGLMTASSNAKIAGIDKEIEAEKKRDGKSKQSLEKIKQMEAKKEQMAKKAFEQNKKMQIAMTIINTATAIMGVVAHESGKVGAAAIVFATMIAAMGAAQIGMIKNQQYQGSGSSDTASAAAPMDLSIGSRGSEVNVANQANRGELAYLRGEAGRGSIGNFTPAASGRRGYAAGSEGVVVGERGPEVITPSMPVDITPNDKIGGGTTNVNFTIHAVDAAGLEQTIQSQRGNIIGMIREAANGYGINFLENVDVDTLDESGGTY